MSGLSADSVIVRREGLFSAPVDHELIMLDPESGCYYRLDSIGQKVWQLLAQRQTVEAICCALEPEFDVSADTCRGDVLRFLGQLDLAGLLEPLA